MSVRLTKIKRLQVYNKCKGRYGYCGDTIALLEMQVDHIVAQYLFKERIINKSGIPDFLKHLTTQDLNHIDNLMSSCRVCNKRKDTHHLESFRNELMEQSARARKTSANYRMALKYHQIQETPKPIVFYFELLK